jgi:hypothetical protein
MQQGDEGSGEMDGGRMESTQPDVFIMGATPNQKLKNQVTYDYRTLTSPT